MNIIKYAYDKGMRVMKNGSCKGVSGKILKPYYKQGYPFVGIRTEHGKKRHVAIHRLQAYQKFGDKLFQDGIQVRHLNSIRNDASWDNIEIGTALENDADKPQSSRDVVLRASSKATRKYDKDQVRTYHKNYGNSYKKTMNHFGISSKGTLHHILNNDFK